MTAEFAERYGPWALIAGASEGTGREFALQIAARGVDTILVARRSGPLDELAAEIRKLGRECRVVSLDLSAADAVERLVEATAGLDVGLFIANAGADPNGSRFLDKPVADWVELVQRNVMFTLQACHHFGGLMQARGRGGIVLVNSFACYSGGSSLASYAGSKAFQLSFAESLWAELRPAGVDVMTLVLGKTDTPAFRALLAQGGFPPAEDAADPGEVVAHGLAHIADGPVQNWGLAEHESGMAPTSAAERRARVIAMDAAAKEIFGD